MKYAIGLDVGGTKIHTIIAEWNKNFLDARKLPKIVKSNRVKVQNKKNADKFFGEIIREVNSLINEFGEKNIARIGVGIAGPITKEKVTLYSPNIPLKNFPTLSRLKENFRLPIYLGNDANCFAWAEHLFGAASRASSTVGITLGTGVGGGIVLDCNGKPFLWEGYYGGAAEIGHMILDGEHDFEYLCSSHAQYLWKGGDPLSIELKARKGDKNSKEIYNKYGFWLGVGVANIVNVLEPQVVVIGGSIAKAWDLFEKDMHATAEKYIISSLAKKTKIVQAKLGDDAGALGAAYLTDYI